MQPILSSIIIIYHYYHLAEDTHNLKLCRLWGDNHFQAEDF